MVPCILTLLCPIYEICVLHFHAKALKRGSGVFQTCLPDIHFWGQQAFCSCSCPILLLQQISKTWGNKASPRLPLYIYLYRMAFSQPFNELCGLLMRSLPWQLCPAKLPHHTLYIFQRMEWIKPGLFRALASFLALIYFSSQDLVTLVMHSHMV